MDWKMILIGLAMMVAGGFLAWRLRKTKFGAEMGPGCAMAFALLMLLTGVLAVFVGFLVKI
ncbi:MAG: hypothetical protein B7Z38_05505 [Rhodobacterales bacterium 12-64-8]|jgi:hypothetical protein|nr:MAG: hypothetical protein B7Z38_05505 [Rhodobacterales bacterium 12-64-8]OYX46680.1 MAG: hypothetical protein B7Y90_14845 [Alphaproteobacteria bacterium 32-64-14]